jgi:hypothetical protein
LDTSHSVWRNGKKVDFDGYSPTDGFLVDAKAFNYAKHFDDKLDPKVYYQGAKKLLKAAKSQSEAANGVPIRWHVAEPKMVPILKKMLKDAEIEGIDVVYTRRL